jgi:hypothetical protein
MQMFQAIIKNKDGVIVSAPTFKSDSIESFNDCIEKHYMKTQAKTWINVSDKMPHSFTSKKKS